MAVSSNTTTAPKIDRACVMRDAWEQTKAWYLHRGRTFRFVRAEFQWALRCAWHDAKMRLLDAVQQRADAIRVEIEMLSYKPVRINIDARRQALAAELAALA